LAECRRLYIQENVTGEQNVEFRGFFENLVDRAGISASSASGVISEVPIYGVLGSSKHRGGPGLEEFRAFSRRSVSL
jgi:hypothetical protein